MNTEDLVKQITKTETLLEHSKAEALRWTTQYKTLTTELKTLKTNLKNASVKPKKSTTKVVSMSNDDNYFAN